MVQHITFNEFLPLVLGKSGIHEHGLTLYAKVGARNGRRKHREKSTVRHTSVGSPSTLKWVSKMEEEYIEKNPWSGIYKHWLSLYAKSGLQNGRRIHREKSTFRHTQAWAHLQCKDGSSIGGRIHREKSTAWLTRP
jgi:hypothetical protein